MQITPTLTEGLKRGYRVVVPAADLEAKLGGELEALKGKVRVNGFRPGKVPAGYLRKLYGRSLMGELVQGSVADATKRITEGEGLRLAFEPQVSLPQSEDEVAGVIEGRADLAFDLGMEVLPAIEPADLSDLILTREVAEVADEAVQMALERLAAQNRSFSAAPEGTAAEAGHRVTVDFTGSIDGEAFDGGRGEGIEVELGAGNFIPGFEDGLVGAVAGEVRTVLGTFPEAYLRPELAGKTASFEVSVTAIAAPEPLSFDDALGKAFGFDDLGALREATRARIRAEYDGMSRQRLKRRLLDALDERHGFDLPPTLVTQEFDNVWRQVTGDLERSGRSFADEETTEEAAREEYRGIAERRVRLGLLLAEIGQRAQIGVEDEEVSRALVARARQFPGQEKAVWEFYQKNPAALAELRAPIFEEKVVDHVLSGLALGEAIVSPEVLARDIDEDGESEATPPAETRDAAPAA